MTIGVAILLGLAGLGFVLYPLYRPVLTGVSFARVPSDTSGSQQSVSEREQAARAALQEVELDYQLGNISDEDYNILRERYVRRALVALKSRFEQGQDVLQQERGDEEHVEKVDKTDYDQHIDEMIEEELRRLRHERQVGEESDEVKENKGENADNAIE